MKNIIKPDSKLGITLTKVGTKLRASSPTICLVGGVLTSVSAAFLTVKKSRELTYIMDERQNRIDSIKKVYETQDGDHDEEVYSEADMKTDIKTANKKTVVELSKLYALPAGLYILSMILFVEGNLIMKKRNAALGTALAAAQTAMAGYRDRVRSFVGDELEHDIYNGARKVQKVDEETGELKEVIERDNMTRLTDRADRIFDETNSNWDKEKFANQTFLYRTEEYLNELLVARSCGCEGVGFVFLNEVYDALGFDRTTEGQYLGWYYDSNHQGYIDFGLRAMDEGHRLFANGYERNVWLNFNFDGDIISVIEKRHLKAFGK